MDVSNYKPKFNISQEHLLSLKDYSQSDIYEILHYTNRLKNASLANKKRDLLRGKTVALIFEKPSTRTRISFELGLRQLGGQSLFMSADDMLLGRNETVEDTAKVLTGYGIDGAVLRTDSHDKAEEFAASAGFPVINGLTKRFHPLQALADLYSAYERFGRLDGLKFAYFGAASSTLNSLMIAGTKVGVSISVCTPPSLAPDAELVALCRKQGNIEITDDVNVAAANADVCCTDAFPASHKEVLENYRVTEKIMAAANKDAIFMHRLPAHRGEEVSADVIDSPRSVVFNVAANRLHVQKAVLCLLIANHADKAKNRK